MSSWPCLLHRLLRLLLSGKLLRLRSARTLLRLELLLGLRLSR